MQLKGKRALIFGVASEDSIAWGITKRFIEEGATCVLGFQKRFMSRLWQLTKKDGNFIPGIEQITECDVSNEESVKSFFSEQTGKFDIIIHCIAFAPASALTVPIEETTQEDFELTLTVSSYSLIRLVRNALPYLNKEASTIALTYFGAIQVVPSYKVMGTAKAALESLIRELAASLGQRGVRLNAISAGPIKTLAAQGIPGFNDILNWVAMNAPLRRNVSQTDVANTAVFLASDSSRNITSQTIYVDAGYSLIGAPPNLSEVMEKLDN